MSPGCPPELTGLCSARRTQAGAGARALAARSAGLACLLLGLATGAQAEGSEPAVDAKAQRMDAAIREELVKSQVPSVSVAVLVDGKPTYARAFGLGRLNPDAPARPSMRYCIGSISKQFTATALLMLAEDGKLSLDAPVARVLPNLPHGAEVTVRELLAQVSGYPDYWPQDYVPPGMLLPVTAEELLRRWGRLQFSPGTRWEYSNTNYFIAGLVAEKASGVPLQKFLGQRVFNPLGMSGVLDVDAAPLAKEDSQGYRRFGLGPPRPAPKEGKGWLFAAASLAMPAEDLARWDLAMLQGKLLRRASYEQLWRPFTLKSGEATHYGLGVSLTRIRDHRALFHDGEVSGYTAGNAVFPDDGAAIVVLINQDASSGALERIQDRIARLLFEPTSEGRTGAARRLFASLQRGRLDRSLLTENAQSYFSPEALRDFARSLGPLGPPTEFEETARRTRGGMTFLRYRVSFPKETLSVSAYETPDGRFEQYQVQKD